MGHRRDVSSGALCGSTVIARHPRSYARDALIFEPRHYLALLERKTGALDQAAPLAGWELPEAFGRLRRLLEARLGKAGTREYVQVLRLLEDFRLAHVSGAVRDALALGVIGFDAVKHLVLCRIEHRPPRLDLAQYPHLPAACSAPGFLDSGLTVFASTLPRPARRGHVAPERDFDSGISPASTARCTFA